MPSTERNASGPHAVHGGHRECRYDVAGCSAVSVHGRYSGVLEHGDECQSQCRADGARDGGKWLKTKSGILRENAPSPIERVRYFDFREIRRNG